MAKIAGPNGAIEYERDCWGYPRICARDLAEGTFARGYMHGLDRQVQLHLSLVAARGRLMEFMGDVELARLMDYATRSLNFTGGLDAQLEQVPKHLMPLLQTYCDGLNAGIAARGRPLLLRLAKIPTEVFTPSTLVLLYRLSIYFGLASLEHIKTMVATELAVSDSNTSGLELLFGDVVNCADREGLQGTQLPPVHFVPPPMVAGSNAFAVSAARSSNGSALLMGEFHMEIARFPPIVYISHEQYADGTYLQGASIPGIAWLHAGRNRDVSWTYTYAHTDAIDCLIERCENGSYVAGDEVRPLRRRVEHAKQKGRKTAHEWIFYDHDHGTVLGDASRSGMYPSLRWNGRDHVGHELAAGLEISKHKDAVTLAEHNRKLLAFSGHGVFADRAGHIASTQTGQVASRPDGWRGVVPRRGWDLTRRDFALADEASRSVVVDPHEGYIVSANATIDAPEGPVWCSGPESDGRFRRLVQLLADDSSVDIADMVACSYDRTDLTAQRLLAAWQSLLPDDPDAGSLCKWAAAGADGAADQGERWLQLFYTLHHEVTHDVAAQLIGDTSARRLFVELDLGALFQGHIDRALCLEKPTIVDAETLRQALGRAWAKTRTRLKNNDGSAVFTVPFDNMLLKGGLARALGFGQNSIRVPGSPCSPFQMRVLKIGDERIVAGPAFHMVFDMGEDGGWYNVPGGASERRFGPGYGKGVEAWRDAAFAPLGTPSGTGPKNVVGG